MGRNRQGREPRRIGILLGSLIIFGPSLIFGWIIFLRGYSWSSRTAVMAHMATRAFLAWVVWVSAADIGWG